MTLALRKANGGYSHDAYLRMGDQLRVTNQNGGNTHDSLLKCNQGVFVKDQSSSDKRHISIAGYRGGSGGSLTVDDTNLKLPAIGGGAGGGFHANVNLNPGGVAIARTLNGGARKEQIRIPVNTSGQLEINRDTGDAVRNIKLSDLGVTFNRRNGGGTANVQTLAGNYIKRFTGSYIKDVSGSYLKDGSGSYIQNSRGAYMNQLRDSSIQDVMRSYIHNSNNSYIQRGVGSYMDTLGSSYVQNSNASYLQNIQGSYVLDVNNTYIQNATGAGGQVPAGTFPAVAAY